MNEHRKWLYFPGGLPPPPPPDADGNVSHEQIERVVQSCAFKTTTSVIMGGALGYAFGAFFGSQGNLDHLNPDAPKLSAWQNVKAGFKDANQRGFRMARGFAMAGGLFVACECIVEKKRGRSDIYNSLMGGCGAGAMLAVRSGPSGMAIGCAGFAAFSGLIDTVMLGE